MKQKDYLLCSAFIFLALAVMHALRILNSWPARIAEFDVPMAVSYFALVIAAFLSYTGFKLSK